MLLRQWSFAAVALGSLSVTVAMPLLGQNPFDNPAAAPKTPAKEKAAPQPQLPPAAASPAPKPTPVTANFRPAAPRANGGAGERLQVDANRILDCVIKAIDEVQVPAQEAGVLAELNVTEGQEIAAGALLARLDDGQPKLQKKAALAEYNAAFEKSKSTIDERYAKKASDVAYAEWQKSEEANRNAPGSVSQVELMRLKLTYERGLLETERAQEDRKLAGLTAAAKNVEVEAADEAIKRRQLASTIGGVVDAITPHRGEWVKPGDIVMKVVNLEKLLIEGYVNIAQFSREQLLNREIEIEVKLTQGKIARVPGRIVFFNQVSEAGGEFRIKAEFQNQKNPQTGQWLLQPGLAADIILPVK